MMLPLALALQTATLDADPLKAAMTCALVAADRPAEGRSAFERVGELSYFLGQAALLAVEKGAHVASRFHRLAEDLKTAPSPAATQSEMAQLRAACEARSPLALRTTLPDLPADPLERDLACFMASGLAQGIVGKLPDAQPEKPRLAALDRRYGPRLPEERMTAYTRSVGGDPQVVTDKMLTTIFGLGNIAAVIRSCEVAPD